jgi:putative FmdB family regulatory protein
MPVYEYACLDCQHTFDALRSMSQADDPIACPDCGKEHTSRMISLFAAHSDGKVVAGGDAPDCGTCSASSCAGCGQ